MILKYDISPLNCGTCAAKIEQKLKKLPKVLSVYLNIVFSTLTVEIEGNNKDLIDSEIKKIINQTDSSCTISLKEKE